jgi:hypothetical protein
MSNNVIEITTPPSNLIEITPPSGGNLVSILTNPSSTITKAQLGLGNVDNTSDLNKPISTATQTALDLKANIANPTFTGTVGGITATMVGLGSVNNTSDANKPISTATQTALNLKANLASPTFTGIVSGLTAVASTSFTAVIGARYVTTATLTVTDPAGTAVGQSYEVLIGNGNCTIGGVVYAPSRIEIIRYYNGSAWTTLAPILTQNLTLNGTANVAASQTAASDSSLMTRSLSGDEPFFNMGACYRPASLLLGSAGTGSSATTIAGQNALASLNSGTATSGYSRATLGRGLSTAPAFSGGGITFTRKMGVATRFFMGSRNADPRIRLVIGGNGAAPATADADALSVVGFGWESRLNGTTQEIRIFSHNGTTYSTSPSWQSLGATGDNLYNAYYISIYSDGAGNITCYYGMNGTRNLSTITLSGGPTSAGNSTNSYVDLVLTNSSVATTNYSIILTDAMFITRI